MFILLFLIFYEISIAMKIQKKKPRSQWKGTHKYEKVRLANSQNEICFHFFMDSGENRKLEYIRAASICMRKTSLTLINKERCIFIIFFPSSSVFFYSIHIFQFFRWIVPNSLFLWKMRWFCYERTFSWMELTIKLLDFLWMHWIFDKCSCANSVTK